MWFIFLIWTLISIIALTTALFFKFDKDYTSFKNDTLNQARIMAGYTSLKMEQPFLVLRQLLIEQSTRDKGTDHQGLFEYTIEQTDIFNSIIHLNKQAKIVQIGFQPEFQKIAPRLVGKDLSDVISFLDSRENEFRWSDVTTSILTGEPTVMVGQKFDAGYMIAELKLSRFKEYLSSLATNSTDRIFIVDQKGTPLFGSENENARNAKEISKVDNLSDWLEETPGTLTTDYGWSRHLTVSLPLENEPWYLILSRDFVTPANTYLITFGIFLSTALVMGGITVTMLIDSFSENQKRMEEYLNSDFKEGARPLPKINFFYFKETWFLFRVMSNDLIHSHDKQKQIDSCNELYWDLYKEKNNRDNI